MFEFILDIHKILFINPPRNCFLNSLCTGGTCTGLTQTTTFI